MTLGRKFTPEEIELIRRTQMPPGCAESLIPNVVDSLVHFGENTGLDPLLRQCWATVRQGKVSVQATIDGFRIVAGRSGEYEGQSEPQWCGPDGVWKTVWTDAKAPTAARIGVFRKGFREPIYGIALYSEFVQTRSQDNGGGANSMWTKMPANQLLKCGESLALRKAFPEYLSGIYTDAEMGQADNDEEPAAPMAVGVGATTAQEDASAARRGRSQGPGAPVASRGAGSAPAPAEAASPPAQAPTQAGVAEPGQVAAAQATPPATPSVTPPAPAAAQASAPTPPAQAAASAAPRAHETVKSQVSRILDPVRERAGKLGIAPSALGAIFRDRYGHTTQEATVEEAMAFSRLALKAPENKDKFTEYLKTAPVEPAAA